MNQILDIDNNEDNNKKGKFKRGKMPKMKKENHTPIEIHSVVKFFTIAILIFGVSMIGTGCYGMYQDIAKGSKASKPEIYIEQRAQTEIALKITHDKEIATITYQWNEEEQTQVPSNGKKEVETTLQIPTGTNTLKVYAKDINGQEIEYRKEYTIESNINIELTSEGNNLKITANGMEPLQYMTYRWDEEDETRIDIEGNEVEETIEIKKGLHKLTIIVVDINNKTETKEQEINGVTKPKLEVTTDGSSNFIIKASDEDGIKKVQFIINETEKYELDLESQLSLEDRKEFEYAYPLHDGENKLEVTIYNNSDITETFKALVNK